MNQKTEELLAEAQKAVAWLVKQYNLSSRKEEGWEGRERLARAGLAKVVQEVCKERVNGNNPVFYDKYAPESDFLVTVVFSPSETPVDPADWLPYRTNRGYSWGHVASIVNPYVSNQTDRRFLHVYQFGSERVIQSLDEEDISQICLSYVPSEKNQVSSASANVAVSA